MNNSTILPLQRGEGDEADERFDEVALGCDDVLDVLVRLRRLGEIELALRLAEALVLVPALAHDAVHRLVALLHGERGGGRDAAHAASRAVRTGHERIGVAQSTHDVRGRAHRAGDDPELAALGARRALAVDADLPAEVLLEGGVVVVDVDPRFGV